MTDVMFGVVWFKSTLGGNEIWRFIAWVISVLTAYLAGRAARHTLRRFASLMDRGHKPMVAVFLRAASRAVIFSLVAIAVKSGRHFLVLDAVMDQFANTTTSVLVAVAVCYVIYCLVDAACRAWALVAAKTPSKMDDMLVPMVRRTLQVTVVVLGLVQVATILSDKPLTSILAGLGVGGLAVALAAQETIKHFFGSITVLTDKPFELGDTITVDKYTGSVEHVGIRSTRLRTLDGTLITIPNGDLAVRTIENMGKRDFFRRVLDLGVMADTPPVKVERALAILKELLVGHPGLMEDKPPRVVFNDITPSSLNLRVIYWCRLSDYWDFMAFSERVNLMILRRFAEEGIQLAVPPAPVMLAREGGK